MTYIDPKLRKPCIALMGEFSAGKSTLANLLIGSDPLPVQVIATQLPPVWISYGDQAPYRVDIMGNEHSVDPHNLSDVPLEDTSYIKFFCQEDILHKCDLLDMPGISDPNMSSDIWQRVISKADGVIWCSHATQAWRQSEAAVWSELAPALAESSILLLTRIDKIHAERDREKVIRRVRSETAGQFRSCLPISLLQASSELDDYESWLQSGAGDFAKQFLDLLESLAPGSGSASSVVPFSEKTSENAAATPSPSTRIVPRRIKASSPATVRPPRA